MDGVGKVDGGGAGGQGDDPAPGREDEDLVVEHIDLQAADVVLGLHVLLVFQQAADPVELLGALVDALLVAPVGRDAVFGGLVHLPGADLHLEGDALLADDGGVEALVHIGLGGGDIVLEAAGYRGVEVVDVPEDVVAVGDGVHDDPEGIEVVELVDRLVLGLHLAVDGVDMLDAACDGAVDAHALEPLGQAVLDPAHELQALGLMGVEVVHDAVVGLRLEVAEAQVLQLPFELLHTETVGQGRIDVHRLLGFGDLLRRRLVLHGAHIVEPVADLDEDHADVLGHGQEHLPQILHLLLLGRGVGGTGQLCDAFDEGGDGGAEQGGDLLIGRGGVLQTVVEQGGQDGVGVEADLGHDFGHGQGMNDIGRTVLPLLVLVLFLRVVEGLVHALDVGVGRIAPDRLDHRFIMFRD